MRAHVHTSDADERRVASSAFGMCEGCCRRRRDVASYVEAGKRSCEMRGGAGGECSVAVVKAKISFRRYFILFIIINIFSRMKREARKIESPDATVSAALGQATNRAG